MRNGAGKVGQGERGVRGEKRWAARVSWKAGRGKSISMNRNTVTPRFKVGYHQRKKQIRVPRRGINNKKRATTSGTRHRSGHLGPWGEIKWFM